MHALGDLGIATAGLRQAGEIALDVGQEDRHADGGKMLGQGLRRTVLPVPAAPVTRPRRFAIRGSRRHSARSFWAMSRPSGMADLLGLQRTHLRGTGSCTLARLLHRIGIGHCHAHAAARIALRLAEQA